MRYLKSVTRRYTKRCMATDSVLIGIIVLQQAGWMYYSQVLVNKAMAGSYTSYEETRKSVKIPKRLEDDGPSEDLTALNDFVV